jgi:hypothetical protein
LIFPSALSQVGPGGSAALRAATLLDSLDAKNSHQLN